MTLNTMSTTASPISEKPEATLYTAQVCRGLACLLVAIYHGAALIGNWYGVKPVSYTHLDVYKRQVLV